MTTRPSVVTAVVPAGGPAAERATMPLLALVSRGAVDEDYAWVARRRVESGAPATRPGRHLLASTAVVLFGLLIAIAALQTARNASVDNASRDLLVTRVQERRATVADQKSQLRDLRRGNDDLASDRTRVAGTLAGAEAALGEQQRVTGFGGVEGPGLRVTVDDNPDGDADGRVRATDLRLLVNALWQSGAEGIAVNGRRLTTLSSIVNAGIAVQVDQAPVAPPYVVIAVGSLATLPRGLSDTATGQQFVALSRQFGFALDPRTLTDVALPAAPATRLRLRDATPVTAATGDQPDDQGGGS